MSWRLNRISENGLIMVVGTGGTGSMVAEGLCRLLIGKDHRIILVDHDKVEKRNLGRQNFYKSDLGKFKSEVLARRLSLAYKREVLYFTEPVQQLPVGVRGELTIGCVDNAEAREKLQYAGRHIMGGLYSYSRMGGWYIDAGNSEHSGQVLIGNGLLQPYELGRSFLPDILDHGDPAGGICHSLPLPTIQQPGLLAPETKPRRPRDCAERVARDEQSPVINLAMASLVLQFVHLLLSGELTWMGAFIDLKAGTMSTVPADPGTVSRITGIPVRRLEYHPRPVKERERVRA